MPKIFISYRRADSADTAGRVFDHLTAAFGEGSVLKDVDSIPPGAEFAKIIAEQITECDAVIILIGPSWLTARNPEGNPRLLDSTDLVRIEVEQALSMPILVIPALVGNASMPSVEEMPISLRRLGEKNAVSIRPDPDFRRDIERLIRELQRRFRSGSWAQPPSLRMALPPPLDASLSDTSARVLPGW